MIDFKNSIGKTKILTGKISKKLLLMMANPIRFRI